MKPEPRVLIVDDEPLMRVPLTDRLEDEGYVVFAADSVQKGREILETQALDVAVLDLRLPDGSGLDLLRVAMASSSHPDVLLITAYGTVDAAVAAMKLGARDFLTKPFSTDALLDAIRGCLTSRESLCGSCADGNAEPFCRLVGQSAPMQALYRHIEAVARSEGAVIVQGETGTGKELVAEAIHTRSGRSRRKMVRLNCAAIPESLFESELFGVERGAYTGADKRRMGRFEQANGGTLFFDEIDEMPLQPQAKLLRAIQEGEFERLGGTESVHVDVRIIAATKVDLSQRVAVGGFRQDLFYRLNVLPVVLPPLRARGEDVLLLAEHFLAEAQRSALPQRGFSFSDETRAFLRAYPFPGNVRELRNMVSRATALCRGRLILPEHLGASVPADPPATDERATQTGASLADSVAVAEAHRIREALDAAEGHKGKAADMLGISRKTLWKKLKQLDEKQGK